VGVGPYDIVLNMLAAFKVRAETYIL
jgi:hypothetical protein